MKELDYYSCGKLLITGEYFILDGALGLALPVQRGQRLLIESVPATSMQIHWQSFDWQNQCWLDVVFHETHFSDTHFEPDEKTHMLLRVLKAARKLNPAFLQDKQFIAAKSFLEFPANWGLGSSSTLIYNIARWAEVNPFELLAETFGGSGYDVAVAIARAPIIFHLSNAGPFFEKVHFNPPFRHQLFFIHLNTKQSSREGIARYKNYVSNKENTIAQLNTITENVLTALTLSEFEYLINLHENIIAACLQLEKAKNLYFRDYWGSIKSLGAWGGDFVMATSQISEIETRAYFKKKGFDVILRYDEIISIP